MLQQSTTLNQRPSFSFSSTKVKDVCWWAINIILVGTAVLIKFTILSNVALLALFILSWKIFTQKEKRMSIYFCIGLLLFSSYSIVNGNNISLIIRFALIVLFLGLAYFIKLSKKVICNALITTSLVYCCLLLAGEIYLLFFFNKSFLPTLRYEIISLGIGDIYPKYGSFYAIQLVGTAALPFIFMLSFVYRLFYSKILVKRALLLLGIIIAGNFGFLVAISVFLFTLCFPIRLTIRRWFNYFVISCIGVVILLPIATDFIYKTIEQKKEVSNAIRVEQATFLIEDFTETPISTLFGKGLGNTIDIKGHFRDYRNNQYFELQSLYFLNQLGIIPFIVFILWNLYLTYKYIPIGRFKLVYLCYVIYAITNPYIFNTNQIVVIISLVSLCNNYKNNKNKTLQKIGE